MALTVGMTHADTIPATYAANTLFAGEGGLCSTFSFTSDSDAATCAVAHGPLPSCAWHLLSYGPYPDFHNGYNYRYNAAPGCGDGERGAEWVMGNPPICPVNSSVISATTCQCSPGYVAFNGRCMVSIDPPKNNGPTCNTAGTNPVNIGVGNKFQIEKDLSATANGTLELIRYYNSSNNSSTITTGTYFGSAWRHTYDRYIAVNQLSTPMLATVYRPEGQVLYFTLNNGVWVSDNDIKDTLTTLTDNTGVITGWLYRKANNDERETYTASGYLASITDRAGRTQTLTYSNTSTPAAIASAPGLLLQVADSFGRQLNFTYDAQYRIQTLTDAVGGLYTYAYDGNNNLISVTYPDSKVRTYVYNEPANISTVSLPHALTGIVDENNQRFATFKYDASGRAVSTEHAVGIEKVSLSYTTDANGTITATTATDALNTSRTYAFSSLLGVAKNTSVSQPCNSGCGGASATTYDANGNVATKTDFNGNQTIYSYDLTRNLETSRTEAYNTAQARTITTQWHATYRLPTLITEPGKTTAFTYDTSGNLLTKTITDTALNKSRTWTYTYNSFGQVLTADGPRTDITDTTTYTYYSSASNAAGNVHSIGDLATVTDAAGLVTSITNYDLNGRPLSITDSNNVVTTLTYWPRGWLKTRTVNSVQTTQYDYDNLGQLTKVTLPDGSYLSYTYDTAHRLTDIADGSIAGGLTGNKIHYTLDAMGNRLQEDIKDPSNNILRTRSRVFDTLNRLQKDIGGTSPSTQITQYGYDNNGNLTTITDPLNHVTTNGYDALNRLVTITDPANGVASTTYNALDQTTQVKDPRLVATNFTINALGDITLTQSPDSGNTNKVFDAAGNVTQKTDARGIVSNYTYDALNRVTSISYPASTAENASFTYDSTTNGNLGKGKLTGYSNDGGATVLTYDAYGNTTLQTDMIGSIFYTTAYQYDAANRVSQITYPSGRIVIYTRNALGQITQVQTKDTATSTAVTLISSATYEPLGPLKTLTYGNAVTTSFTHDADYRVSRITTTSTPVWDFIYSYDAAGNITGIADQISTFGKTFGYDNLNRVTSDTNNTGTWTYQYDANGNRTKRINTSTQTLTYSTTSNRMTKNGSTTLSLDNAGNLLTNSTKTYSYNNANRLITYSVSGTTKATYSYNALGQRTVRTVKPQHLHYDLNGRYLDETLLNSNGTFNARYEYIYVDDKPIAQIKTLYGTNNAVSSRRTTYIHTDHLNTPRLMTDSTKKIVWRWDGDAYGKTAPNQNPDGDSTTDILNLRFPGQHFETESGFYYNINRDYDPDTRYISSDPIGLVGGLNTYAYVGGNPLSFIDPLGLQSPAMCLNPANAAACAAAGMGPEVNAAGSAAVNAAGAAATMGTVGDTGRSGEAANDSSHTEKKQCPPDDDQWCRREQTRLNNNRTFISAMQGSTSLKVQQQYINAKKEFNISVNIHNSICPNNKVDPL